MGNLPSQHRTFLGSMFDTKHHKELIQSKDKCTLPKQMIMLEYGDELGGIISTTVKTEGIVYIPHGSLVEGKCSLKDVKIPYNVVITSRKLPDTVPMDKPYNGFEYVEHYRIRRGVYVTGFIRVSDHDNLNCKFIMGYELKIYGRKHLPTNIYAKTQKRIKAKDLNKD